MNLVVAEGLTKTYKLGEIEVRALRGIDMEIQEGSFISIVGPSGSGKTTLLNLIGCLDRATDGHLKVAGTDVSRLDRSAAATFRGVNIGFVFQNFNLLPVLTVYENIEYPLVMVQQHSASARRKRVLGLLEAVGVSDQKDKFPEQISGGQKQRVAIARALVTRPKLVLADEPTANLDHKNAFMIIELMKTVKDKYQTTFVFSTHDTRIIGEAEVKYTLEDGKIRDGRKS
jgi:putative ABC transport system ATP-binding protein